MVRIFLGDLQNSILPISGDSWTLWLIPKPTPLHIVSFSKFKLFAISLTMQPMVPSGFDSPGADHFGLWRRFDKCTGYVVVVIQFACPRFFRYRMMFFFDTASCAETAAPSYLTYKHRLLQQQANTHTHTHVRGTWLVWTGPSHNWELALAVPSRWIPWTLGLLDLKLERWGWWHRILDTKGWGWVTLGWEGSESTSNCGPSQSHPLVFFPFWSDHREW